MLGSFASLRMTQSLVSFLCVFVTLWLFVRQPHYALGRLGHLSQQDKELVENLASSIVNKLIHRTMVTLKSEVNSSNGPAFVEAARRFFHLDQSSGDGPEAGRCVDRAKYLDPVSEESEHEEQESPLRKRGR